MVTKIIHMLLIFHVSFRNLFLMSKYSNNYFLICIVVGKSADFWQKSSNDTIAVSLAKDMIGAILIEWSQED